MKGFVLFLCIGLLVGTGSAQASEASHRAAAARLLQVVHMRDTLNKTMERVIDLQIHAAPQMAPFRDVMLKFAHKYMSYDSLKGALVNEYTQAFTEKELDDMIAFYETPTGRKAIRLMPRLMSQGARIGLEQVRAHQGELQAMIQARLEEIKKDGANKQGPARTRS